jgi:hypothetical protein
MKKSTIYSLKLDCSDDESIRIQDALRQHGFEYDVIWMNENSSRFYIDVTNKDASYVLRVIELATCNEKGMSFYYRWTTNSPETRVLGSFCSAMMEVYRIADDSNRVRLQRAFPEWFV